MKEKKKSSTSTDAVKKLPQDFLNRVKKPLKYIKPKDPIPLEFGQLWSTKIRPEFPLKDMGVKTDDPRLVVILVDTSKSKEDEIVVAPVSVDTEYATDFDLIVSGTAGYEFMVEVWNETPMLKRNLHAFLTDLSENYKETLRNLYRRLYNESTKGALPLPHTGPPIINEKDPRIPFQKHEVKAVEYLSLPAYQLFEKWEKEAAKVSLVKQVSWIKAKIGKGMVKVFDISGDVSMRTMPVLALRKGKKGTYKPGKTPRVKLAEVEMDVSFICREKKCAVSLSLVNFKKKPNSEIELVNREGNLIEKKPCSEQMLFDNISPGTYTFRYFVKSKLSDEFIVEIVT